MVQKICLGPIMGVGILSSASDQVNIKTVSQLVAYKQNNFKNKKCSDRLR
jgi:hypothetical protein